jgi:hypothetical protein
MARDIGLDGYQTLRFPAWLIRANPEYVARKILEVPRRAGYRGQTAPPNPPGCDTLAPGRGR